MNYGLVLRKLREKENKTQAQVAKEININRVQYNNYENDYNTIPIKHLNSLANLFDVSIDYLLGFTTKKKYEKSSLDIDVNLIKVRLKKLRVDNKITQGKLAQMLNVARTTITEYERGTNIIATPFLYMICKEYNTSADYILGKTEIDYLKK